MDIIKSHSFQLNMFNYERNNKNIYIILGTLQRRRELSFYWTEALEELETEDPLGEFSYYCLPYLRRPALVFVDFCRRTSSN